jgi:hypothetical protein
MTTYTVSIVALQATGQPLPNGRVELKLNGLDVIGGMVAPEPIPAALDANGLGSVVLLSNIDGTQGRLYDVTFYDQNGGLIWSGTARIPQSNCNLHDVLNLTAPPALSDAQAAQLAAQGYAALAASYAGSTVNFDGGAPDSVYGSIPGIDGGTP